MRKKLISPNDPWCFPQIPDQPEDEWCFPDTPPRLPTAEQDERWCFPDEPPRRTRKRDPLRSWLG
jgi:hypothetical protein